MLVFIYSVFLACRLALSETRVQWEPARNQAQTDIKMSSYCYQNCLKDLTLRVAQWAC